jgi:trigger factor
MADQWKAQTSNNLQHSLYHDLLDKTKIEFPESFLKRWLLNGGEKPKTAEEVENEYPAFSNALKWNLITDKIVTENKIEVTPEDIKEAARRQLFSYLGGLPQGDEQPWVEDYVNKMMQDRRFVEETYQNQRTNKILQWVETQVKPVEKAITAEEFNTLNEEHRHHHHE